MTGISIFYPMAALVLLTFIVTFRMGQLRVRYIKQRKVTLKEARVSATAPYPVDAINAAAHFHNLLQTPVLLYTVCLAALSLNLVDNILIILAWAYVAVRIAHAWVHMTYNNVIHRFYAFVAGLTLLAAMWVKLTLRLAGF